MNVQGGKGRRVAIAILPPMLMLVWCRVLLGHPCAFINEGWGEPFSVDDNTMMKEKNYKIYQGSKQQKRGGGGRGGKSGKPVQAPAQGQSGESPTVQWADLRVVRKGLGKSREGGTANGGDPAWRVWLLPPTQTPHFNCTATVVEIDE